MDLGGKEGNAHGPPEIACAFVRGRSVLSPPHDGSRARAFSTPGTSRTRGAHIVRNLGRVSRR